MKTQNREENTRDQSFFLTITLLQQKDSLLNTQILTNFVHPLELTKMLSEKRIFSSDCPICRSRIIFFCCKSRGFLWKEKSEFCLFVAKSEFYFRGAALRTYFAFRPTGEWHQKFFVHWDVKKDYLIFYGSRQNSNGGQILSLRTRPKKECFFFVFSVRAEGQIA